MVNLLPEFCDRIRSYDSLSADVVGRVRHIGDVSQTRQLTSGALRRVVVVVTVGPGQHGGQRGEEVVEGPGQEHVVVAVDEEHDHGSCYPDTWVT